MESVVFAVMDCKQQRPLERFVFEITQKKQDPEGMAYLIRVEQALRAFLLKLDVSETLLTELPSGEFLSFFLKHLVNYFFDSY